MTEGDYGYLRRFLHGRSGLDLGPDKLYLVESRLRNVWQGAGLETLEALVTELRRQRDPDLAAAAVEAMTTNETMFFRDRLVFDALRDTVLPRIAAARAGSRRVRVWSAAASTGQEAYSVAMIAAEILPRSAGWQVSILGTDISQAAIGRARTGCYSQFEVQRGLPIMKLLRHFEQGAAGWTISAELRRGVEYRVFNLLEPLASLGRFDLILCRNLLIYFDIPTRRALLAKLAAALADGGVLCLGSSESVTGLCDELMADPDARGFVVKAGTSGAAQRGAVRAFG